MTHYSKFEERGEQNAKHDPVNHPFHYTNHPSGVECIDVTQHMNFCLGNAMKYIWRAGLKSDDAIQDLEKAVFYLNKEIERLKKNSTKSRIDIINKAVKDGELKINPMENNSGWAGTGGLLGLKNRAEDLIEGVEVDLNKHLPDEDDQMAGYYD